MKYFVIVGIKWVKSEFSRKTIFKLFDPMIMERW